MSKPLDSVKVLDLTQAWAGPIGSMLLADFGAEIIKVEPPETGDHVRAWTPPGCRGESPHFLAANRNKKSLTLNLKTREGKEIFLQLARETDVIMENFRPGVMKKFGLHYEAIQPINPRVIYCSISGFGQTGPSRNDAAYDLIVQGMGGAMSVTGEEGGKPLKPGIAQGDIMGALGGTIAILAALMGRAKTGQGCYIDVSMLDIQVMAMGHQIVNYLISGNIARPLGTSHPILTPYETFSTKTFSINIAANTPGHWADLCHILGLPELIDDAKFKNVEVRIQHRRELIPLLEQALQSKPGEEWIALLKEKGIPCGPINDVSMVVKEPQVLHRDMIIEVENRKMGRVRIPGMPLRVCGMTGKDPVAPPPLLGEHNEEILCGRLGYSKEELKKFQEKGII
ncbi:MAG: CoA transferase [Deltaproteobacteria bacterium]|nr:CoA transferase [Deltaproteobacteria bacterium]